MSSSDIEDVRAGQVEKLNLSYSDLTTLPPSIFTLGEYVKDFSAAGNEITEIPPEIGNLVGLRSLNLKGNRITTLPDTIGHLTNLEHLLLYHNKLSHLPASVGQLSHLVELSLHHNPLLKSIPPTISNLQLLRTITVNGCGLSSFDLPPGSLPLVTDLHLDGNNLQGPIPLCIFYMRSLKTLYINDNALSSLLPSDTPLDPATQSPLWAGLASSLKMLILKGNQIHTVPPNTLCHLSELQMLSLAQNRISDLPPDVVGMANIISLDIGMNRFARLPPVILQLTTLDYLDISYNDIVELPPSLMDLPYLSSLYISGNPIDLPPRPTDRTKVHATQKSNSPDMIMPGLYLGSVLSAKDKWSLKKLGVSHVLTVTDEVDPIHPDHFVYKVVRVQDDPTEDLMAHFEDCKRFIDEGRKNGGVLVHCMAGISRSATIVILYTMLENKIGGNEAMELVRARRSVICPNQGFREQIQKMEALFKSGVEYM